MREKDEIPVQRLLQQLRVAIEVKRKMVVKRTGHNKPYVCLSIVERLVQ